MRNTGLTTITDFSVNVSLDYADCYDTFSFNTNLASFETAQFTISETECGSFPSPFYEEPSVIEMDIYKVNGVNSGSEGLLKEVNVAMRESRRVVLMEHFTSSTCDYPCIQIGRAHV